MDIPLILRWPPLLILSLSEHFILEAADIVSPGPEVAFIIGIAKVLAVQPSVGGFVWFVSVIAFNFFFFIQTPLNVDKKSIIN